MSTLSARGVDFAFDGAPVLRGVDVTAASGALTAVLGPNGAGKSTLVRVLAGLLPPRAGVVALDDRPITAMRPRDLARAVAIVLDAPAMSFAWTALELVLMGRAPWVAAGRLETDDDVARALAALAEVDAERFADRPYTALSAGERQRVLLARALCQDTPVLLLDEPTSHLDPAHALAVGDLCRGLAEGGRAVLCVLHDLNLAARIAHRIVFVADGAVVAEGTPDEVLVPDTIRAVYGVESRRVDGPGERPALVLSAALDRRSDGA